MPYKCATSSGYFHKFGIPLVYERRRMHIKLVKINLVMKLIENDLHKMGECVLLSFFFVTFNAILQLLFPVVGYELPARSQHYPQRSAVKKHLY